MADERNKPGLTPEEVKSLAPAQKAARGAYGALIGRVSVLLFPKGPSPEARPGSGLLLATGQGTPFLLTARHLLEETKSLSALAVPDRCRRAEGARAEGGAHVSKQTESVRSRWPARRSFSQLAEADSPGRRDSSR